MVRIETFAVEQWMDEHENTPGVLNIAETCCDSVSVDELVALASKDGQSISSPIKYSARLGYGAIRGSATLRRRIADLYKSSGPTAADPTSSSGSGSGSGSGYDPSQSEGLVDDPVPPDQVVVMPGAIGANFIVLYTLLGPGDHVVCVYPTYQQLYSVPESLGCEVSLWRLREENGFVPDVGELEGLLRPNTKMIIINNPSNPTGSTTPLSALRSLVALAAPRGIILLSDEVYRPLFHSLPGPPPPSLLSLGYSNSIATGSMSKSFSLAGLRLGWMASCSADLVERICGGRHFTTISVSQLDDQVASFALSPEVLPRLLSRNLALARRNLDMLSDFVDRFPQRLQWVRPTAGTTAFIRFLEPPAAADGGGDGRPVQDDTELCLSLLRDTSALVVPGRRCFGRDVDFEGYVRIGYVCATEVLENALDRLGRWLQTENPIGSTA